MPVISSAYRTGCASGGTRRVRGVVQQTLPASPALRALAGVTLSSTFGKGLFYTATTALFFTYLVDMTPAQPERGS